MDGINGTRHVTGVMSDSDALLWTIERDPVLRSPIVAVVVLGGTPDWPEVAHRLERLTVSVPRLRSVARPRPGGLGSPRWVEDDAFDLDQHLERVAAPGPGTLRTVLDLAQLAGSTAFDPELPLWQAHFVDGVEGGAAVVIKVHHAVLDGVGGIGVLAGLLDTEPSPVRRDVGPAGPRPAAPRALSDVITAPLRDLASAGRWVVDELGRTVTHPDEQVRRAQATARSVVRLLAPAPAPLSPLLGGRGLDRHFDAFVVDTDRLHAAAAAEGGTLNDAFVAAVVRGVARYHEVHGKAVGGLRALMPINIRSSGDAAAGNHFVPARFVLDASVESPRRLLRHVHEEAMAWKRAPALGLSDRLAGVLNHLPPSLATAVFGSMLKGDDFVATNVPGPPVETWLAGAQVAGIYAFGPTSGAALNVALITPAGRGCVGVNVDVAAAPDPAVLSRCVADGFAELAAAAPAAGRHRAPAGAARRPARTGARR